MQRLIKSGICVVLLISSTYVLALRDPFSCAHKHGTFAQSQATPSGVTTDKVIAPQAQNDSSEWHIIAQKEDSVVMQHKDGSIREITLSGK